ncbi:PREDICTED: synaptic vesicle glycoprotein 2B-like, partial [Nicrophorus vespilloides]|uniref:Synaptic vesicle glycoprotein 2B-like n=1 Tax=Nicrophorus vespilloides TaxID=110193 RepID=A0ABM1MGS3_NICVS
MADFEEAIEATKFGTFNILIILLGLPSGWVTIFETTDISFVNPVAHCDLNYGIDEGGFIFSVTYLGENLGMLTGSPVWGFFSDTFGRRKVIIFCYTMHAFVVSITGQSQTYIMLLVLKFIGGFIVNGPFSILTTIFSEFHSAKYRARVMLMIGVIAASANIILPVVAWGILLLQVNINIGDYHFHSWNILLHLCAIPSIACAIAYIFVPESPKYLMASGRNDEALLVFKKMYRLNTGKPENTYPVRDLVEEVLIGMDDEDDANTQDMSKAKMAYRKMAKGFKQSSKLFFPPHLKCFLIICVMQLGVMMGLNTFRLWIPEIFSTL